MKHFNSSNLDTIRNDINAALATVGAKHGLQMSIDRITYTEDTFRCKLNALVADAAPAVKDETSSQEVKWKSQFLANPSRFGMSASDLGRQVVLKGIKYIIVGARPKANADIVLKSPAGNHVAYTAAAVRNSFTA